MGKTVTKTVTLCQVALLPTQKQTISNARGIVADMVTIRKGAKSHLYIEEWMIERDIGQTALANRVGVSRKTIWKWSSKQDLLNHQKIKAIADGLGIEPDQLYRHPRVESLDEIIKDADAETRSIAADIVRRLVKKAS